MRPPGVARTAASPSLAEPWTGIRIALAGAEPGALPRVHGAFRLPAAEAAAIDRRLHRAIVLVAAQEGLCLAATPFRDHVLCADDQEESGGAVQGWFDVDLGEVLAEPAPGPLFVNASLGPHVSGVVETEGRSQP
jgi:hypothetical protein